MTRLARNFRRRGYLIILAAAALIGLAALWLGLFSGVDRFLQDRLFLERTADPRVVILAIDEASLAHFGQWPWPRATFAKIIDGLNVLEPAAIGIDINFAEPSRYGTSDDEALARALRESKAPVVLIEEAAPLDLGGGAPRAARTIKPLPLLRDHASFGYANVIADADGVVRSFAPLILDEGGSITPQFALAVLEKAHIPYRLPESGTLHINYAGGPESFHTASLALRTDPASIAEYRGFNIYFGVMTPIVKKARGIVDKYIGDALLAFWCEPFAKGHCADQAVHTALEMLEAIPSINEELSRRGLPSIAMRIGINTGDVIVGNIGSDERLDFAVIGDPVNVASRLEKLNKEFGTRLLISSTT